MVPVPADPRRSVPDSAMPRVPADDAIAGFTVALFVAVAGASPWALGILIFQRPQGWQADAGQYALLLADVIVAVTAVVVAVGVTRSRAHRERVAAAGPVRAVRSRPAVTARDDDGLDPADQMLLHRAAEAVRAVAAARIVADGLIDEVTTAAALAGQQAEIAAALREQARLRAQRSELTEPRPGSAAAELLAEHRQAARTARASIVGRVQALERYAAEVRRADADYRDWRQHTVVTELSGAHLDMLARTAADEHRIAELDALTDQARSVRRALRGKPD